MVMRDSTLNVWEMRSELEHTVAVWTHTNYGLCDPPSIDEITANVQQAFNFIKRYDSDIYFVIGPNEDPGFAVGWAFDLEDTFMYEECIESEFMALEVWWEFFGFVSREVQPRDWELRSKIAEMICVDESRLAEPQDRATFLSSLVEDS